MKQADLERMTPDELHQAKLRVDEQIAALREEKRTIARIEDQKLTEQALQAKLASLSDAERAALAQLVNAGDIPSAESVGTPGQ